eukprot:PhF_6_TR5142/c0_g1_i2/m.7338
MLYGDILSCVYPFVSYADRESFQLVSQVWHGAVPYVNVLTPSGVERKREDILEHKHISAKLLKIPNLDSSSTLFSTYYRPMDVDALLLREEDDMGFGLFDDEEDEHESDLVLKLLDGSPQPQWLPSVLPRLRLLGIRSHNDLHNLTRVFPLMTSLRTIVLSQFSLSRQMLETFPPTLEEVELDQTQVSVTYSLCEVLAKQCPRLRALTMDSMATNVTSLKYFNPQHFRIARLRGGHIDLNMFFKSLGSSPVCAFLEELHILQDSGTVHHDSFVSFASNAKRLRDFQLNVKHIAGDSTATPTTFLALGEGCPRLYSVTLCMGGRPEMLDEELLRQVLPPTCGLKVQLPPQPRVIADDEADWNDEYDCGYGLF